MEQFIGVGAGLIIGLILGILVLIVLGLVLKWLWNSTLPEVLGVNQVSLFQAIKIMLIASLLFGGHRFVAVQHAGDGSPNSIQAYLSD